MRVRVRAATRRSALFLRDREEVLHERVVLVRHQPFFTSNTSKSSSIVVKKSSGAWRMRWTKRWFAELRRLSLRYSRGRDVPALPVDDLPLGQRQVRTFTWMRWPVFGKKVSISAETKKSS
jgi:hypothetical protein